MSDAHTNPARAIVRAGFICGAAFIVASAIRGCVHGVDWKADLLWTAGISLRFVGGSAPSPAGKGGPGAAAVQELREARPR